MESTDTTCCTPWVYFVSNFQTSYNLLGTFSWQQYKTKVLPHLALLRSSNIMSSFSVCSHFPVLLCTILSCSGDMSYCQTLLYCWHGWFACVLTHRAQTAHLHCGTAQPVQTSSCYFSVFLYLNSVFKLQLLSKKNYNVILGLPNNWQHSKDKKKHFYEMCNFVQNNFFS